MGKIFTILLKYAKLGIVRAEFGNGKDILLILLR